MAAEPRMRRWKDPRDGKAWRIIYRPGVEEDPPTVRQLREELVFEGEDEGGAEAGPAALGGHLHAPAVYGSHLEGLTDRDLQGLLDQARSERRMERKTSGWGGRISGEEG